MLRVLGVRALALPPTQPQTPFMSSDSQTKATRTLVVKNKMGIHARPAAMIVRTNNKFADTEVWVAKDGETINGKSIMGLMMLAAGQGSKLDFIAEGPNAEKVLNELENVFERKFEEA